PRPSWRFSADASRRERDVDRHLARGPARRAAAGRPRRVGCGTCGRLRRGARGDDGGGAGAARRPCLGRLAGGPRRRRTGVGARRPRARARRRRPPRLRAGDGGARRPRPRRDARGRAAAIGRGPAAHRRDRGRRDVARRSRRARRKRDGARRRLGRRRARRGGDHLGRAPRPREPRDAPSRRFHNARRRCGPYRGGRARGGAFLVVSARPVPAWSLPPGDAPAVEAPGPWREALTREWAIGGSRGAVDVCIVDSGIEAGHPLVGPVASAHAVARGEDDAVQIVEDELGDVVGHGTACAGIVRSLAPDCRLHSVRVLGAGNSGAGDLILAGLRHAIASGHRVINLSLSTTKRRFAEELHELADDAYFRGTVIVASAHNLPVDSYPWRFSSVISVGSHERPDPLAWYANPDPPVELFARGVDVDVAWLGGG